VSRESFVDIARRLLNKHHKVAVAVEECRLAIDVKDIEHEECRDSE
jgi:hypothetical protein